MEKIDLDKIPKDERWVWGNPEILASIDKGMKEAKEGKLSIHNKDIKGCTIRV